MSTNPVRVPPEELEQFVSETERRLNVLRRVKELRANRANALREISTIDHELAELAPALKLALLDAHR